MNGFVAPQNIQSVMARETIIPTAVFWNRLEGRPRRRDFGRALKAEVRDPLWLITRQWQFGEFIADDAGSPVAAKVAWQTNELATFHAHGGGALPYDPYLPLETRIEARSVPLELAGRLHNADLRLALGRRWKQLLDANGHAARIPDFMGQYRFVAPDPASAADNVVTAHAGAWQTIAAIAGRAIDGGALLLHLLAGHAASDGFGLVDSEKTAIDDLGDDFREWAQHIFFQPENKTLDCWRPRQLEYAARVSAPNGKQPAMLAAPEYRGGTLDWFSFDAVAAGNEPGANDEPPLNVTSFLPTTIQFDGMPNTRHWAFEDGNTNFGDINVDTTDIAKLLLIEFGLLFANDWFMLPIPLPTGSLTSIAGLAVTNVFGERFWIEPAVTQAGPVRTWSMFTLTNKGAADRRLFIPAIAPALLKSPPVEDVVCIRDEVSNMVWGIENIVQLSDGSSRRGREVGNELHAKYQAAVPAPAPAAPVLDNAAKIKYVLMTSVAENWIPFVPVHVNGSNRQTELQRAGMPRLLEGLQGVQPEKIAPRTRIMREGLEQQPKVAYYISEEEVERAGTVVVSHWQRCRWTGGRAITWLGLQRTVGRGEGSSGLAFDTIVPKPQPKVL